MTAIKIVAMVSLVLLLTVFTAGCFEEYQKPAMDLISPVVILKGSTQYCDAYPEECAVTNTTAAPTVSNASYAIVETPSPPPTPRPTVTIEPSVKYSFVDPFAGGERYQGQWYKWTWLNASGLQDANRGIVVYGHSYLAALTQWNDAWGNYQITKAPGGYRFLAVYVHEEDFGPDDTGLWGYQSNYFHLQYAREPHSAFTGYNRVYRILELEDSKKDYYGIDALKPFGSQRIYKGQSSAEFGGYYLEEYWGLRTGKGNSWDGYLLYLIPASITDDDILLVGNFAGKTVFWRFDTDMKIYPVENVNVRQQPIIIAPLPADINSTREHERVKT